MRRSATDGASPHGLSERFVQRAGWTRYSCSGRPVERAASRLREKPGSSASPSARAKRVHRTCKPARAMSTRWKMAPPVLIPPLDGRIRTPAQASRRNHVPRRRDRRPAEYGEVRQPKCPGWIDSNSPCGAVGPAIGRCRPLRDLPRPAGARREHHGAALIRRLDDHRQPGDRSSIDPDAQGPRRARGWRMSSARRGAEVNTCTTRRSTRSPAA